MHKVHRNCKRKLLQPSSETCNVSSFQKFYKYRFNMKREDQQDATIRCLLLTPVWTCFGHHHAHLQENEGPVTAFGVLFWFCWMWLVAVVGRCLAGCDQYEGFCSTLNRNLKYRFVYPLKTRCTNWCKREGFFLAKMGTVIPTLAYISLLLWMWVFQNKQGASVTGCVKNIEAPTEASCLEWK